MFDTQISINFRKCNIAAILVFYQVTPICKPKNIEKLSAQVLTQLRQWVLLVRENELSPHFPLFIRNNSEFDYGSSKFF